VGRDTSLALRPYWHARMSLEAELDRLCNAQRYERSKARRAGRSASPSMLPRYVIANETNQYIYMSRCWARDAVRVSDCFGSGPTARKNRARERKATEETAKKALFSHG
jgi:hypothetical protein